MFFACSFVNSFVSVIYVNLVATNNNASHQFCFADQYVFPSLVHHHRSKQMLLGFLVFLLLLVRSEISL
jgi:hypothetical protein